MSKVCQLFSGSSGNSILVSGSGHNFLVDIGVSAKRCEKALLDIGIEPDSIDGIFVTHEHKDHASGIRVFATRHKVPVFAPDACIGAMLESGDLNDKQTIIPFEHHMEHCGIEVKAFNQSHDSVDCVGYRFELPDGRSTAVCTDTGFITDNARSILKGVDLIFIESNHEISMVQADSYPYPLKKRILGAYGHLSNFDCGEYIKELALDGTTRFVLSHLSRENNMPHIARQTALAALNEAGLIEDKDFRLYVSPPENDSRSIAL